MTRQIQLTNIEIPIFEKAKLTNIPFFLVRESDPWSSIQPVPPAEFVQACAPCETCGDVRRRTVKDMSGIETFGVPCLNCRIELVSQCSWCYEYGLVADEFRHWGPRAHNRRTLGYAYAVGSPLVIIAQPSADTWPATECIVVMGQRIEHWKPTHNPSGAIVTFDITDHLAHYGDPKLLVGKWLIKLNVMKK